MPAMKRHHLARLDDLSFFLKLKCFRFYGRVKVSYIAFHGEIPSFEGMTSYGRKETFMVSN